MRTTSQKGARSREAIINATLICIARQGVTAVTHRSIAKQAGVPHSLTTYFFSSLNELIGVAFEYYVNIADSDSQSIKRSTEQYLASIDARDRAAPLKRPEIIAHLGRLLTDFVLHVSTVHSVGIAVELSILYAYRGDDALRHMALAHREKHVAELAELILQLTPDRVDDAFVDASLLLSLLHKLELDCLNHPDLPQRELASREISRLLSLMFAIDGVQHKLVA